MPASPKDTASDHDILIELRATTTQNFQYVREDIQRLTDGTHAQLADHENRIRNLETDTVLTDTYSPAHAALIKKIDILQRYIWMGVGIVAVLVVAINVSIKFIK